MNFLKIYMHREDTLFAMKYSDKLKYSQDISYLKKGNEKLQKKFLYYF